MKIVIPLIILLSSMTEVVNATEVQVLSAVVKDKNIDNAQVIIQRLGEPSKTVTTNSAGKATLEAIDDEKSLMLIKKSGYSTLVAKCPCGDLTYALSPVMESLDGMRVVLTWGQNPRDLDSHLSFPGNHIFFSSKTGSQANLDVDDTTSYGPETITIEKRKIGQRYVYAVHDYTNKSSSRSQSLSKSKARVEVYVGQTLIRTYLSKPDKNATSWVVFGIDGEGAFHDIDQYMYLDSKPLDKHLASLIKGNTFESHASISKDTKTKAKRLNVRGEKVYHEDRLEEAMYLFQDAVNLYPSYGQAYSNLGLTYQKLNRTAEALWANRKAIELASGKTKKRVQASSFYNIAKIYEAKEQWSDALNNFEKALSLRQHNAYVKGIARMKEKM